MNFLSKAILGIACSACFIASASGQAPAKKKVSPKTKAPISKSVKTTADQPKKTSSIQTSNPFGNSLKIIVPGDQNKPFKVGYSGELHFVIRNSKDSIIANSYQAKQAIKYTLDKARFKGSLEDFLSQLHEGDSASFVVHSDSLFKYAGESNRPKFLASGSGLTYTTKIFKVTDPKVLLAEAEKKIDDYAKASGKTFKQYPSGLRIAVTQEGTGAQAMAGDTMTMHYKGMLLDGTKFDASYDRNQPFTFVLGMRQVIEGWDEGVAQLKVGSKAVLLIPSKLGYGERGAGGSIPPNSPLVFEVEVLKAAAPVKK